MKYVSETGRHREIIIHQIEKYFGTLEKLNGIDIGFGGDPILPNSICMDQYEKYTTNVIQTANQNLYGDATNLFWFKDNCLDYVYSAHVLEDFDPSKTYNVFSEWLRIVKQNGLLILDLPNEKKYREVCASRGYRSNPRHQILDMSIDYMKELTKDFNIELIHTQDELPPDGYSFLMIWRKL